MPTVKWWKYFNGNFIRILLRFFWLSGIIELYFSLFSHHLKHFLTLSGTLSTYTCRWLIMRQYVDHLMCYEHWEWLLPTQYRVCQTRERYELFLCDRHEPIVLTQISFNILKAWMSGYIPHTIVNATTYPCPDLRQFKSVKEIADIALYWPLNVNIFSYWLVSIKLLHLKWCRMLFCGIEKILTTRIDWDKLLINAFTCKESSNGNIDILCIPITLPFHWIYITKWFNRSHTTQVSSISNLETKLF